MRRFGDAVRTVLPLACQTRRIIFCTAIAIDSVADTDGAAFCASWCRLCIRAALFILQEGKVLSLRTWASTTKIGS
jgi:hypothetical protein